MLENAGSKIEICRSGLGVVVMAARASEALSVISC